MAAASVHLGFEVGTGHPVSIPLRHMVVTGQTQEAGKTTTLEALIARSGVKAIAFVTKRGEGSFGDARIIPPYFREQADWQFVAAILEASRGEKLKFERAWIIRASKGAKTLADVQRNVRKAMETAKGMSADVYLTLDAYLEAVVPQIDAVEWARRVELVPGLNVMDLTALNVEMQHLVIRSTIDWVLNHESHTVVVVPEAWKFIPQGRGTPVKLAAEAFIRQAAGLKNYLWLDSQDIAGVEKIILKSVPVWILGVQRESNEIKRTLDQIPAGIAKPKAAEIATLGLGEFIACHGRTTTKVYVQPHGMDEDDALKIARGQKTADMYVRVNRPKPIEHEATVTEQEARELRAANERLARENRELRERLDSLTRDKAAESTPAKRSARADADLGGSRASNGTQAVGDVDSIYAEVRRRLLDEEPAALLRVLQSRPELRVEVTRETITADGKSTRGRIGRLIADGFFSEARTSSDILNELARRGSQPSNIEFGNEMKALMEMGFFTRDNKWYKLEPKSVVNVVER